MTDREELAQRIEENHGNILGLSTVRLSIENRALIVAALREPQAEVTDGWRSIESAPKSGVFILANAKGEVAPASIRTDIHRAVHNMSGFHIAHNMSGFSDWTYGEPATHWMPLPSPPKKESKCPPQ